MERVNFNYNFENLHACISINGSPSLNGNSSSSDNSVISPIVPLKRGPAPRQRVKENSRLLPEDAIRIMTEWYEKNYANPYPSFRDCEIMADAGKVSVNQVKQWFVNVRRRTHNEFRKRRATRPIKRNNKISVDDTNETEYGVSSATNSINNCVQSYNTNSMQDITNNLSIPESDSGYLTKSTANLVSHDDDATSHSISNEYYSNPALDYSNKEQKQSTQMYDTTTNYLYWNNTSPTMNNYTNANAYYNYNYNANYYTSTPNFQNNYVNSWYYNQKY